jgi:hypothetical protein
MPVDPTEHVISASNILFGLTRFLTLTLPAEWRMRRSYLEPDVHSNVRRGDTIWVEAGQADQIVYHPARRIALDLTVSVKRGKRDALRTKDAGAQVRGACTVNGHEAAYVLGEARVGFLGRRRARTLGVGLHCPELERTIVLRFTGTCQESDLLEIFACLPASRCH